MQRYPLSKTEYGIFVEQLSNVNTAYNLPYIIDIPQAVDIERLCVAIRAVIEAHPTLKTAFAMDEKGEPYRYIRDCDVDITILEGDDLDPYSLIKPFDLQKDILFRIWLLKAVEGNRLLLDIHHSVFDGSSIGILLDQISRAYAGETVEPEVFTSLDYACEEAKKLGSKAYEEAKAYYREAFSGIDIDSSLYKDKNDRESVAREIGGQKAIIS